MRDHDGMHGCDCVSTAAAGVDAVVFNLRSVTGETHYINAVQFGCLPIAKAADEMLGIVVVSHRMDERFVDE